MRDAADDQTMAWPTAWTRASLELAVLALVCSHGPTHGYHLAQRLLQAGLGEVRGGTLYPVLGRLKEQGLVGGHWAASDTGPGRKVIEATTQGRHILATRRARWREWSTRVTAVLDEGTGPRA